MPKNYPFYLKSTVILFGLILFVYAILNLREVLVPLSFSLMLAILLNPICEWLQQRKVPNVVAISLSMVFAFIVIAGIGYFLTMQMASFGDQMPLLEKKFNSLFHNLQRWVAGDIGYSMDKQNKLIAEGEASLKPLIGQTLGTVMGTLSVLFLLPVYTFLFIYYKKLILNFLFEVFAEENSKEVGVILQQTKGAIQSYMVGLLLEALIVAALNTLALVILGVHYAVLLGVIGAILNVLPYIGGIIAIALPLIIATITKDGTHTQIGIIISYLVIQFVDNHFLVPLVVSSKVRINALISIVIVILGGAVWGVSGMFLSIPFIGVLKIIFDRVPDLKPWGKLLGDEIPTRHRGQLLRRRPKKKTLAEKVISGLDTENPEPATQKNASPAARRRHTVRKTSPGRSL